MQTITPQKYPFFRNPIKKRLKTYQSINKTEQSTDSLKQSVPLKVRRRNYIKQASNQKSIKIFDFRSKKTPLNTNHVSTEQDPYKSYTEDFVIPVSNIGHPLQTIDQIKLTKKEDLPESQIRDFRINQQNPLIVAKKGSFSHNSNNRSHDPNKRTAVFTRKGLYSINSLQKDKKSPLYFYPADRYKSLNSKQILLNTQKSSLPYADHLIDKQKQQRLQTRKNSFSISRNRYLLTKEQKNPSNANVKNMTNKKFRSHSNSHSQVIDSNMDKLIKKQFSSLSVKQLNAQPIIRNHLDPMYLTEFEKQEIRNYKDVYYIGHKAYLRKYKQQNNFRDQKNNYKPIVGDHIAYRFEIVRILGSGAFGKVLQVIDHKSADNKKRKYALKILKKSEDLYEQFKLQIRILKIVKQNPQAIKNIVQIKGDFQFRNHICIVTQLLDLNVYAFIKNQQFEGLSLDITRKIMIQVLQALLFLHHKQIVHCDIKPENIVFKEQGKSGVKLVDFGSACFIDRKEFTYIQSRYYRSPEIVLVKPYDQKIDVWSTGCLAFQIYTGTPLFPARCEQEQIQMLKETLGQPPTHFLNQCERADQFLFPSDSPKFPISKRVDASKSSPAFIDFMEKMIRWSPEERMTIKEALMHQFILEGLPQKVKKEHLSQMKSSNPYELYE